VLRNSVYVIVRLHACVDPASLCWWFITLKEVSAADIVANQNSARGLNLSRDGSYNSSKVANPWKQQFCFQAPTAA